MHQLGVRTSAWAQRFARALMQGLLAAALLTGPIAEAVEPGAPWRIAILMAADPALPAMQQHDRALRAALQAAAPNGVTFFTDSIDTYRFDYRRFSTQFIDLQRRKYEGQTIDLVIGVGDPAIEAVRDQRDAVWPGTPVVLAALDKEALDGTRIPKDMVSVQWTLDIEGTLSLIESLQPGARRLIVVGGSTDFDRALSQRVMAGAKARARWQTESWNTLPVPELRARLAGLDTSTAVFYTTISRSVNGESMFPGVVLAELTAVSKAPIYGLYDSYFDRGLTAGSVIDFERSGREAAQAAIAILNGSTGAPGASTPTLSRCIADYRQLSRYELPMAALPPGCDLRNPPRNLWTEYRQTVLVAGTVLLLQALTIGALLLQRRWRRQAEADAGQRGIELARAMRFAAMGELTASIAHEINQPLGAILANAEAAELMLRNGDASAQALAQILADIQSQDLRATEVIRRLRNLLEKNEVLQSPMAFHTALRDALSLIEPEARRRDIDLHSALEAIDDQILGDPVQLQQVVVNLILNAMDAIDQGSPPLRRLGIRTRDGADCIEVEISDTGIGIDPADRDSIFESFYTTKPHGMGLGLPIVRAIVAAHLGSIKLAPGDTGGTVATVSLPRRLNQSALNGPSRLDAAPAFTTAP